MESDNHHIIILILTFHRIRISLTLGHSTMESIDDMLAAEEEILDEQVPGKGSILDAVEHKKGSKFRASAIVFTVQMENWDPAAMKAQWDSGKFFRYIIGQWELAPTTKKKHFQGYAQLFKQVGSRKKFQQHLGGGKCWCAKARGSSEENQQYCSKETFVGKGNRIEGTAVFEYGKAVKKKGERTDKESIQGMLNDGASVEEVAEAYFGTWTGSYKAIDRYHQMVTKKKADKFRKVNVEVHYGAAGANKSRTVEELARAEGGYYRPIINNNGQIWFSNYAGEKSLILDDFYGQVKFNFMLRLLDGYRMEIETKGGQTYALWENVYITSNVHPKDWWHKYETIPDEKVVGFQRRVSKIVKYYAKRKRSGWVNESTVGEPPKKKPVNPFRINGGFMGMNKPRKI